MAISLMSKLLPEFKQEFDSYEIVAAGGGKFEIFADGKQIYSKLATGEFPDEDAIVKALKQHGGR